MARVEPATSVEAPVMLALMGVVFMAAFTWIGWDAHQECKANPAYRAQHATY